MTMSTTRRRLLLLHQTCHFIFTTSTLSRAFTVSCVFAYFKLYFCLFCLLIIFILTISSTVAFRLFMVHKTIDHRYPSGLHSRTVGHNKATQSLLGHLYVSQFVSLFPYCIFHIAPPSCFPCFVSK